MRGGLDRLQKEMDALTYNSRTVLNALIRSTVVSGSSQGYTVDRAGVQIVLDRIDIYRLYRFYQEWEVNNFSQDTVESIGINQKPYKGFDDIRQEQDTIEVRDVNGIGTVGATTDALVKHSKMLYLNADNLEQESVNDYWLGLLRESNNPKLISNSSPIPINLRTPVFDENLSTTRYNQHPTYLFPNAYYILDAFGYAGDGVDHRLDGNSWTIGADDYLSLEATAIALGGVNPTSIYKTKSRRNGELDSNGNQIRDNYSTAWGYDTHARARYSTAGGQSSVISLNASASVSIGERNLVSNKNSSVLGGIRNVGSGEYIGIIGGSSNNAIGDYSGILAGHSNVVGGEYFEFGFPSNNVSNPDCVISADDCTATTKTKGSLFGRNAITINGNQVGKFFTGDTVRLFNFTVTVEGESGVRYYETQGEIFDTLDASITSVEYVNPETNPDNINAGLTIITLSVDVTNNGIVDGGRIARLISADGKFRYGNNSVAMNYNNIAMGENQTVVGHYNYISVTSRFMVGSGTSSNRGNAVTILDDALYLQATPRNENMYYQVDGFSGVEILDYTVRAKSIGNSTMFLDNNLALFGYAANGEILRKGLSVNNKGDTRLIGDGRNIILASSILTNVPIDPTRSDIKLYSSNGVTINAEDALLFESLLGAEAGITFRTSGNVSYNWGGALSLRGNTFGSLFTTGDQFAYGLNIGNISEYTYDGTIFFSRLYKSGIYHIDGSLTIGNGINEITGNTGTTKGLISTIFSHNVSNNDVEGFEIFGTTYSSDASLGQGRLAVSKFRIKDDEYSSYDTKSLAWKSDVDAIGKWVDLISDVGIFGVSSVSVGSGSLSVTYTDKGDISQIIQNMKFTYINNTVIINLRISFDSISSLWGGFSGQEILISLNPSLFNREFQNDGMTPGAWDILGNMEKNRVRALCVAPRSIKVEPINPSTLEGVSTFTLIDELRT